MSSHPPSTTNSRRSSAYSTATPSTPKSIVSTSIMLKTASDLSSDEITDFRDGIIYTTLKSSVNEKMERLERRVQSFERRVEALERELERERRGGGGRRMEKGTEPEPANVPVTALPASTTATKVTESHPPTSSIVSSSSSSAKDSGIECALPPAVKTEAALQQAELGRERSFTNSSLRGMAEGSRGGRKPSMLEEHFAGEDLGPKGPIGIVGQESGKPGEPKFL
ncbi:hypothetical protein MMC20_001219 [Loxospora ochrophaea]|nr:hypothetical protein [Loxospora ochrophaea]